MWHLSHRHIVVIVALLMPSLSSVAATLSFIDLAAKHLAFDANTYRLYATVPGVAGPGVGNSITRIDPVSRAIEYSDFIGSEPNAIAISDDGSVVYVGVDGANSMRAYDTGSRTSGSLINLGSDSFLGPYRAEDIAVKPGDPTTVAVSRRNLCCSPRHEGVAIYSNGIKLPNETPGHTGANRIEFSSNGRLYGYNNETTGFGFYDMTVNGAGVTIGSSVSRLISGFGVDIIEADGRIYATTGATVNPVTSTLFGTYAASGRVAPDVDAGLVHFLTGSGASTTLRTFDLETFILLETMNLVGVTGSPIDFFALGNDQFAFNTTDGKVYFYGNVAAVPLPPALLLLAGALLAVPRRRRVHGSSGRVRKLLLAAAVCTVGGLVSSQALAYTVHSLSLQTNDIVYSPITERVYATVPSTAGPGLGNSITAINPWTRSIENSVFIGSTPNELTLAAGTTTVWAAIDGAFGIRSMDVATMTPGPLYNLGSESGNLLEVDGIQAIPGWTEAVAVSRGWVGSTGQSGIAIYENGVALPQVGANRDAASTMAFSADGSTLLGFNGFDTGFDLWRFAVSSSGLTLESSVDRLISGFGGIQVEMADDILYSSSGVVVDPASLTALGTYAASGPMEAVPELGLVFFMQGSTLRTFDLDTFILLDSFEVAGISGNVDQLVHVGNGDLIFNTGGGQIYFLEAAPVPIPAPAMLLAGGLGWLAMSVRRASRLTRSLTASRVCWEPGAVSR